MMTLRADKQQNVLWYVVFITHKIRLGHYHPKNLTSQIKISSTTPVIRAIMYWTVDTVKLLNNVVVGTGQ